MSDSPDGLRTALTDPRAEVRRAAVLRAASELTSYPAMREAVLSALRDPVWCVREAAASAAGSFVSTDTGVHTLLVTTTLQDSSPHVRLAAAVSAGAQIEPERDYGSAVRHRFERQRMRATFALGFAAPARALEAVQLLATAAADSHPKVRLTALRALARLEPTAALTAVGLIVRKCAEADPGIAAAAREAWARVLTVPAAAALLPLAPYPGTTDLLGAQSAVGELSPEHPLRQEWAAPPAPSPEGTTAHRLAKHLATVCERALLAGGNGPPSVKSV